MKEIQGVLYWCACLALPCPACPPCLPACPPRSVLLLLEMRLGAHARYRTATSRRLPALSNNSNDGDWVDSCSALVEHMDGRLEIVRWLEVAPQGALRVHSSLTMPYADSSLLLDWKISSPGAAPSTASESAL